MEDLDVRELRAQYDSEDYERVGPVRPVPADVLIIVLARLLRPN